MIANALGSRHEGMTLKHDKRLYRISRVNHQGTYIVVETRTGRGNERLVLANNTEVVVTP
jgi:hypothetical protein